MKVKNLDDFDVAGKRVLVRVDFNVPLDKEDSSKILDTTRVDLALPTIRALLEKGVKTITLMSHLGRPKGQVVDKYSLAPVATYLASKLGTDVILTEKSVDCGVKELLDLKDTKIVMLENLRFHPEEEKNDEDFAFKLSQYGDLYINDAFGAAHRHHASVDKVPSLFKDKAQGLLMQKEVSALSRILGKPAKPFVAVMGGAKVADKIKTIEKLLPKVDSLLIGGAMAYPFLKVQGHEIGKSLTSEEDEALAARLLKLDTSKKIKLPTDHMASTEFGGSPQKVTELTAGLMGLDIGENSINEYSKILKAAKTVFWNGPMGLFENEEYALGTNAVAKAISESESFSVVGGGDSVSAVNKSGLASTFSHISTGGGASLEYIEKGELPGVKALIS